MTASPSDPSKPPGNFCHRTRREFLWEAGAGFTGLALTGLLSLDKFFTSQVNAATVAPKCGSVKMNFFTFCTKNGAG